MQIPQQTAHEEPSNLIKPTDSERSGILTSTSCWRKSGRKATCWPSVFDCGLPTRHSSFTCNLTMQSFTHTCSVPHGRRNTKADLQLVPLKSRCSVVQPRASY